MNDTRVWESQTTTDAYARLDSAWRKPDLRTFTLVIENTGANSADVRVNGSVDGGETFEEGAVLAETAVGAGGTEIVNVSDYWTDIDIEVKATTGGSQTDVEARAAGIAA